MESQHDCAKLAKIALLEVAISCGSPSQGQEFAYDKLQELGLTAAIENCSSHTGKNIEITNYPMEKATPTEIYPPHLRHLDTVVAVSKQLRKNVLSAYADNAYPFVIGGDHSLAIGTLAAYGEQEGAENIALIYVDAHADINTEKTSGSHYIHGMDIAVAMGLCTDELTVGTQKVNLLGKNMYIIGGRSIDDPEWEIMREQGVHYYSADDVHERGIEDIIAEILPQVADKKVHISFDVDSLDPSEFTSTGYVLDGGITFTDVKAICREFLPLSTSFECVEYNPTIDKDYADGHKLVRFVSDIAQYLPL